MRKIEDALEEIRIRYEESEERPDDITIVEDILFLIDTVKDLLKEIEEIKNGR